MSAVKISDIQSGLEKLAFYFFTEAVVESNLEESNLETFKSLVKATNGLVYKHFGDEKEICFGKELEENAKHIKGWFEEVSSAQDKAVEKIKNNLGDDAVIEREGIIKAKIHHISSMFIQNLTEYILANYSSQIDTEGTVLPFKVSKEIIEEYEKDKDVKKLRKSLTNQLLSAAKENKMDIPKSEIKKMVSKMVKDIRGIVDQLIKPD